MNRPCCSRRYHVISTHFPCLLGFGLAQRSKGRTTQQKRRKRGTACMWSSWPPRAETLLIDRIETSWQHRPFGILDLPGWTHELTSDTHDPWYATQTLPPSVEKFHRPCLPSPGDHFLLRTVLYCHGLWRIRIPAFRCGLVAPLRSRTHNTH
jgi:hypothetical protein